MLTIETLELLIRPELKSAKNNITRKTNKIFKEAETNKMETEIKSSNAYYNNKTHSHSQTQAYYTKHYYIRKNKKYCNVPT